MRRPCTASSAVLALVLAGALAPRASARDPESETKTSAKGVTYLIRVPKTFDKEKSAVLVVAFLGGKDGTPKGALGDIDYQKSLTDAILLSPTPANGKTWSVTATGDLQRIADLLKEVQNELHPTRTIVTGFDHGANMSYAMALTYPDLVQAAIPQNGDCFMPYQDAPGIKKPVFFVSIPDNYSRNEDTLATVKKLQVAGLPVFVEHTQGDGSSDSKALGRGLDWVQKTLGPGVRPLTDAEANERLAALEKAIREKESGPIAEALPRLVGLPRRLVPKVASLVGAQLASANDDVALAAIGLAGSLGDDGAKVLKKVPASEPARAKAAATALANTRSPLAGEGLLVLLKAPAEDIAVAAAKELENLGGDAALTALVTGLEKAEAPPGDARKAAILEALEKLTGQQLKTAKEWKKWLRERG